MLLLLNEDREGRFGVVGGLACLLLEDTGGFGNCVEKSMIKRNHGRNAI